MEQYFQVVGFDVLIEILAQQGVIYDGDIDTLHDLKCYSYSELESGDYLTKHFEIKVIVKYVNLRDKLTLYDVKRRY